MKKTILFGLLILTSAITFAQTAVVSGNVSDQKGAPVPFAFIYDSQQAYATYADSSGSFTLKGAPSGAVVATGNGFLKKISKVDNPAGMKVVLANDPSGPTAPLTPAMKAVFAQNESFDNMTTGSLDRIGSHPEEVHGSRYLFDHWVHAYAVTPKDSIKQNDNYFFNYDKIDGTFLFTADGKSIHKIVDAEIKTITLFDGNGQVYVFEIVPSIDPKHYVEVLGGGKKYKIYKNIGTKYVKANFVNNGVTQYGNNYDEYKDESDYYVAKLPGGQPQKLSLRKKSIKNAFAADADKVNKFLADNDGDIDDAYLQKLGDYMNQ